MDDAVRVSLRDGFAPLEDEAHRLGNVQPAALREVGREVRTGEVLHHDVRGTGRGLSDALDAGYVLASKRIGHASFAFETPRDVGSIAELGEEDLDGDEGIEAGAGGREDHAHAAYPEDPGNLELAVDDVVDLEGFHAAPWGERGAQALVMGAWAGKGDGS